MTIIKFQNHREISEVVHVFGHYGPAPSVVFRSPELSAAIVNIKVIHWPSKTDPLALV
jgi:hypothetical protein